MKDQNYTATLQVNATAQEVFRCINSVSEWWTEDLDSSAQKLHDEFKSVLATSMFQRKK